MKAPIGILGGTFDPIHFAHIQLAQYVLEKCHLESVRFIPCYEPVHRSAPMVSAIHRLKMTELALESYQEFILDDREIQRKEPSYMIDTLKSLREDFPDSPLCLIMGEDAFAKIDTWKEWRSLLDYTHFIVVSRCLDNDKLCLNKNILMILKQHETKNDRDLRQTLNGKIFFLPMPYLDISASAVRKKLMHKQRAKEIPKKVLDYIEREGIYRVED